MLVRRREIIGYQLRRTTWRPCCRCPCLRQHLAAGSADAVAAVACAQLRMLEHRRRMPSDRPLAAYQQTVADAVAAAAAADRHVALAAPGHTCPIQTNLDSASSFAAAAEAAAVAASSTFAAAALVAAATAPAVGSLVYQSHCRPWTPSSAAAAAAARMLHKFRHRRLADLAFASCIADTQAAAAVAVAAFATSIAGT
jgi:hypothetical protein